MKYLLQREAVDQPIPESASAVYAKNDVYRKYIQNLDVIVSLYNRFVHQYLLSHVYTCMCYFHSLPCSVRDNVLAVEYSLIEDKLTHIDEQMEQALSQLNWTSNGWYMYIC